ncbi:hypothetical protein [uncultured Sutterella sp.]|uniref:hypothetical protein n=1 Tax=uncultured Sutterella sp. TaxID=286133 RepID=UPI002611A368|nr:hypothetical protein [uncultured Sutterella sp.]
MTFNSDQRADAIRGIKRLSRSILSDVEASDSSAYLSYKDLTVVLDPSDVCLLIPSGPDLLSDGYFGSAPIAELYDDDSATEGAVEEMLDEKFETRAMARFAANLVKSPSHSVRSTVLSLPLTGAQYEKLLEDRALDIRVEILQTARAVEMLARRASGRKKLARALMDPDVRRSAREMIRSRGVCRNTASLLQDIMSGAPLPGEAPVKDAPPFLLSLGEGKPSGAPGTAIEITDPSDIESAIGLLAYGYDKKQFPADVLAYPLDFARLFTDDPREFVRRRAAEEAKHDEASALEFARDPSISVRRALCAIPLHLPTEEVEAFLENDPRRIIKMMESLLKRDDADLWAEKFLADPDPEVRAAVKKEIERFLRALDPEDDPDFGSAPGAAVLSTYDDEDDDEDDDEIEVNDFDDLDFMDDSDDIDEVEDYDDEEDEEDEDEDVGSLRDRS